MIGYRDIIDIRWQRSWWCRFLSKNSVSCSCRLCNFIFSFGSSFRFIHFFLNWSFYWLKKKNLHIFNWLSNFLYFFCICNVCFSNLVDIFIQLKPIWLPRPAAVFGSLFCSLNSDREQHLCPFHSASKQTLIITLPPPCLTVARTIFFERKEDCLTGKSIKRKQPCTVSWRKVWRLRIVD